jgi:O-antigen/teichoic acid export membrane protein
MMNLAEIKTKITNLFQSSLAQDTLWMLFSKLFNIVMQAAYFILIARLLGKNSYGSFVAITAIANLVFPFVPLGSEHLLVKNVSTNRATFSANWGNGLVLSAANGTFLTILLFVLSPWLFPGNISWLAILLILVADLIGLAILDLGSKALMAGDMINKNAQLGVLNTCSKLLAALSLMAFFPNPTVVSWGYLYFASSLVITILTIALITKMMGLPRPVFSELKSNLVQGFYFSISTSANNINANLDKSMLSKMSGVGATGIYASAYRFIDVGNTPLLALFGATYTRFFQHGASGIRGSLNFGKRLLPILTFYAIASVIGFWFLSPFVPTILGAEYEEAVEALLWLSPLPAIACFQYLAADVLTGSGNQKSRSIVQVGSALVNVILNIILIPHFSWKGAACATIISDSLRLVCLWLIVYVLYRREGKRDYLPG